MKKLLILLVVFLAVGSLKAVLVKYQIKDAKMIVANQESAVVPREMWPG